MVTRLELANFRNFVSAHLELERGILVLYGQNAQGKTNLLESVHWVSTTRLLRGARDAEAIRDGSDHASVSATTGSGTVVTIELERGSRKRGRLNGASLPRAADVIGRIPTVSFGAGDLAIVQRDPSERRLFLDTSLCQIYPRYLRDLALYKRALDQRNALLKGSQIHAQPPEVYAPWEEALSVHGGALRSQRREYVAQLAEAAAETQESLCPGERLEVTYEAGADESDPRGWYESRRSLDIARGTTSIGPHRDDLKIAVNHRDARYYGSQGQQRSAALSIKLASRAVASAILGEPPMLLLDDVFAELDSSRQMNVLQVAFESSEQAIVTCTDAMPLRSALPESARWIKVVSGTLEEI